MSNRVAIAFSSKDRIELTERTIEPLLQPYKFDLHWVDGSKTDVGRDFPYKYNSDVFMIHHGITGGSCRAIVYALTKMLENPDYDYVGLVENDVLLDDDWFEPTMELFNIPNWPVGAVSARTYKDRVLIQCHGYAVMHNIGAGMQIFTRRAAELILQQYRTGWTTENRRVFSVLSGIDIGGFWAFRGSEHMLVADWAYDHMLAKRGLCSLALTPTKVQQLENIEAQGLELVAEPVKERRNYEAFQLFTDQLYRAGTYDLVVPHLLYDHLYENGTHLVFPHQIPQIGGSYSGDWRFKWSLGFGCFAWRAGEGEPHFSVPVFGPCELIVSGGPEGSKCRIVDDRGFKAEPELLPEGDQGQVFQLTIPAGYAYRKITLTALAPGVTFYGLRAKHAQPTVPADFNFNSLPPL